MPTGEFYRCGSLLQAIHRQHRSGYRLERSTPTSAAEVMRGTLTILDRAVLLASTPWIAAPPIASSQSGRAVGASAVSRQKAAGHV